ncbi:hypothetical protein Rhopal_005798-T1 [Rhodotorula paludigena]|uniref:linoleate 8R-lipoxygenase n=1 Tax=Rhodotorula paludigena TaxID=86838 RepID=A0AAV5GTD7_9BASI|nr:hypothetical protein Rhopal_005798-T1 [Rhodotorula paludigena]
MSSSAAALGNGAPPRSQAGAGPGRRASLNRRSSFFDSVRAKLSRNKASDSSVKTLVDTVVAAPPPAGGDGLKNSEAAALSDDKQKSGLLGSLWEQVKGGTILKDGATLVQAATSATGPIDDREMLLENVVTMLQGLPNDSPIQQPTTNLLLKMLWDELPHPPRSYAGPAYRSADGSGNSFENPKLGAAGTHYARTVPPLHPKNAHLPDPSIVFDALLRRNEFKPHPSGISSLLFSFATIIIHSAFQTSRDDPTINETSSYLDLSPLYGKDQEEQNGVRTFEQGRLHPDIIASSRLFFMPPSVVALLVIFSRNHNYIAGMLYDVNESGKYAPWESLDAVGKKWQDEDLFQRARLVNCGWFLNVIVQDYIRVILNVNTTESQWSLAPNVDIKEIPTGHAPRGTGNAVSVEFNILYRWHAAISQKDEKWIEQLFQECLGDKHVDEMTDADFATAVRTLAMKQGKDPKKWSIPGLERDAAGRFDDNELCRILTEATDEVAGAFGANHTPAIMRIIDVLGIKQARDDWSCCSMNEFRKFLGLKPFATFEEWNSDPSVAATARHLYAHPDNLELFPGLHAEEAKPSQSGSGLATNYTISRAILSDAVALVRGDRFYTTDYNSATLTSWGFQDVQPDQANGSYGGVIGKLLIRNLPRSYKYNSVHALFPFSTPETMRKILTKNGVVDKYSFERPAPVPPIHSVSTYKACLGVLADPTTFGTIYDEPIKACSNDYGYFIAIDDDQEAHKRDRAIQSKALFVDGWQKTMADFYRNKTKELIDECSWSFDGGKTKMLDVVRDVTNLTAVHWCSAQFGMPLKTAKAPHGIFTPQELYLVLSAFFISVFMNFDASAGFKLHAAAKKAAPQLLSLIRLRIKQVQGVPEFLDDFARSVQDYFAGKDVQGIVMGEEAHKYYERILQNKDVPLEKLESSVQSTMTASVANQGQAAAHVINFFLDEANKVHKDEIVRLSKLDTPEADKQMLSIISEAMRLDPQVPLIPRVAKKDTTIQDGDKVVEVKKGDFVFPSMLQASLDPTVFADPTQVKERDPTLYRLFGHGMHTCLGAAIVNISMVQMIKQVFKLPNVRRAPGKAGQLVRFHHDVGGTPCPVYLSAQQTAWPLPVSLSVVYDAE